MTAYYNEIEPYAAQWLRNLISKNLIAPGDVDERSIADVAPSDLAGYTQCHFFAGIGVWSYAARLAGWPDTAPLWTGSAPCQPFSNAGKGSGFDDERHLWPHFNHLISECRPPVVFGEQVASKNADPWIDLVQDDLEALSYAFGSVPFPSASIGAPHIRDRNYWVADDPESGWDRRWNGKQNGGPTQEPQRLCDPEWLAHHHHPRLEGWREPGRECAIVGASATHGFWRDADWLLCRDGRWRPVEPGTFPLVNGAASRVGRLRAYGNAINAQQAKEFISAYRGCKP